MKQRGHSVLKAFFSGNGRLTRLQFLVLVVVTYVLAIVVAAVAIGLFGLNFDYPGGAERIAVIAFTVTLITIFTLLSIRRTHDFGLNWILPTIVVALPGFLRFDIISLLAMAVFCLIPGNKTANQFGPKPAGGWWPSKDQYFEPTKDGPLPYGTVDADHLIGVLAKFAKAEGVIGKPELAVVDTFMREGCGFQGDELTRARDTFRTMKDSASSYADFARGFHKSHSNNPSLLCATFDVLVDIAWADGQITDVERQLLESTIIYFQIEDYVDRAQYADTGSAGQSKTKSHAHTAESDPYTVLGIARGASQEEIRSAYREKCKQYHPDLVQGLGPKIRELAESELKAINDAYDALKAR